MIWLFCKKNKMNDETKHKLLTCVYEHKQRFLLCFYRAWNGYKERGEGWSKPSGAQKNKGRGGADSILAFNTPPPKQKKPHKIHRASGWPHRAQGQRVRGKVSFVPSIPVVLEDAYAHPYSPPPNTHTYTRLHTQTHLYTNLYLLEGGSDPSFCARPTRKRWSTLNVFHNVEKLLWNHRLVRLLLSAVHRLVMDSNNNQ